VAWLERPQRRIRLPTYSDKKKYILSNSQRVWFCMHEHH
jgi:hypothetical protein